MPTEHDFDLLPDTASVEANVLTIGGCSLDSLARRYGTPLYIYDEPTLRRQVRSIESSFSALGARISYAAKACAVLGILRIFAAAGLGLDAVSGGELEAGRRSGFLPESMHLHGNCPSVEELTDAIRAGVHAVVVDSLDELKLVHTIAADLGRRVAVSLRVQLPLTARTHPHLQTGDGSKFGIAYPSDEFLRALQLLRCGGSLALRGLHTHLGSQISDAALYHQAAESMVRLGQEVNNAGLTCRELSLGGGWAVPYVPGDVQLQPGEVASVLAPVFAQRREFQLAVEPGRALVARAAVALYRVGAVKETGRRRIVSVDGGMGDNPRPALYGARYHVLPVASSPSSWSREADVVGRYCESGDALVHGAVLPKLQPGDLLCLPVAGAYQLSMANTYNLVPLPAVALVGNGRSQLLRRRQAIDDLFAQEVKEGASTLAEED